MIGIGDSDDDGLGLIALVECLRSFRANEKVVTWLLFVYRLLLLLLWVLGFGIQVLIVFVVTGCAVLLLELLGPMVGSFSKF